MKKILPKEKEIQQTIIEWLLLKKIFHWRQNSGAFKTETGGFYKMGIVGAPDIFILKDGVIYGCEVKNKAGKQNDNQIAFQKQFTKAGGVYFIARDVEDVIDILCKKLRSG